MENELEIRGTFSREFADRLRDELGGPMVVLSSGFGGERMLTIVGPFTGAQIDKLKSAIAALLGLNQIKNLKISARSIEVGQVPTDKLPELQETISSLLGQLKR
jgi:hypothetical protein